MSENLYPAPPPDFDNFDLDSWLIFGKKPRKARKKSKVKTRPFRQLELDFSTNVNNK